MPDKEIVQLDPIISLSSDDLLLIVDDPASLNITGKITIANAFEYLIKGDLTATAPVTLSITRQVIGGAAVVSMAKAATAVDGYLSSTDWNTFNDKEPALTKGNLTATSPIVLDQTRQVIGGAAAVSIPVATTSVDGYLAAADWTTFNAKQAALSFPLAATLGGTGVNNAGTLTNATATTITGGGTLALGGFTLTVPATGTAALLATANAFTAKQTIVGISDVVQLGVRGPAGQTANVIETYDLWGSTVFAVGPKGHLGVGATSFSNIGAIFYGEWGGATTEYGIRLYSFVTPTANSANLTYGLQFITKKNGTYNHGVVIGVQGVVGQEGTGTIGTAIGNATSIDFYGSGLGGTITEAICFNAGQPYRDGGNTGTIGSQQGLRINNQGAAHVTNAYGIYIYDISGAVALNYAILTNAGNIVFNEGGDANTDFRVESDTYDALFVDASNNSIDIMHHASGLIGFFAQTPAAQQTYTAISNPPTQAEVTAIRDCLVNLGLMKAS